MFFWEFCKQRFLVWCDGKKLPTKKFVGVRKNG